MYEITEQEAIEMFEEELVEKYPLDGTCCLDIGDLLKKADKESYWQLFNEFCKRRSLDVLGD